MGKGYWLKQVTIANADQFLEYLKTVIPLVTSSGGRIIAKKITQNSDKFEWDGGKLGMIVEFNSQENARKLFKSKEFQKYLLLKDFSSRLSLTIID